MAGEAVSRVFVASKIRDLAKHVRRLLSGSAVTVEDLRYDGKTIDMQSEDMAKRLQAVEVTLCDRDALLQWLKAGVTPRLKWAQSASGGVDALMRGLNFQKPQQDFILTRTRGDFGDIMGEYVIGHIIAREKDFAGIRVDQEKRVFNNKRFSVFRPLYDLSIGILGYGTIGKRVADICKFMGMTVWAVNSSQKTSPQNVDHLRGVESLTEVLQNVDYLCSILPNTPATCDLLSGEVLRHCHQKKTVLINMGRGSVISDESLVRAVSREGWLGGAILDVFNQEPLPADSPLWTLPNVLITPHMSGPSFAQPLAQSFVKNLERYTSGQPLHNMVDWHKGY